MPRFPEDSFEVIDLHHWMQPEVMEGVKNGSIKPPDLKELGIKDEIIGAAIDLAISSDYAVIKFGSGIPRKDVVYKQFFAAYQFPHAKSYEQYLPLIEYMFKYLFPVKYLIVDYTNEKSFTDIGLARISDSCMSDHTSKTRSMVIKPYVFKSGDRHTAVVDGFQHSIKFPLIVMPKFAKTNKHGGKPYNKTQFYKLSKLQWTNSEIKLVKNGAAKALHSINKERYKDDFMICGLLLTHILDETSKYVSYGATDGSSIMAEEGMEVDTLSEKFRESKWNKHSDYDGAFVDGGDSSFSFFGNDKQELFSDDKSFKRRKIQ